MCGRVHSCVVISMSFNFRLQKRNLCLHRCAFVLGEANSGGKVVIASQRNIVYEATCWPRFRICDRKLGHTQRGFCIKGLRGHLCTILRDSRIFNFLRALSAGNRKQNHMKTQMYKSCKPQTDPRKTRVYHIPASVHPIAKVISGVIEWTF